MESLGYDYHIVVTVFVLTFLYLQVHAEISIDIANTDIDIFDIIIPWISFKIMGVQKCPPKNK